MKRFVFGILTGIALVPTVALANSSICAVTGNLVLNCGFEGGTQTLSATVPNDWTANAAYLGYTSYNHPENSVFNSGSWALQIGNDDPSSGEGTPTLSQTFADTLGQTYHVTYYLQDQDDGVVTGDTNAFFNAQINGTIKSSFTGATGPGPWTQETFNFTGTGSDTLAFAADTTSGEWFLDDVVVTAVVPLPAAVWLLLSGLGGLGLLLRRRSGAAMSLGLQTVYLDQAARSC